MNGEKDTDFTDKHGFEIEYPLSVLSFPSVSCFNSCGSEWYIVQFLFGVIPIGSN